MTKPVETLTSEKMQRGAGRPRLYDEKAALNAAMLTFWRQGYQMTSLDDLVAQTGASRASLYRSFGDKRAIFIACLDLYSSLYEEKLEVLLTENSTACQTVRELLMASAVRLSDPNMPDGCLRCAATIELSGIDPELDRAIDRANRRYRAGMRRLLEIAVKAKGMTARRADQLALYLSGSVAGLVFLDSAGASRQELINYVNSVMGAWPQA